MDWYCKKQPKQTWCNLNIRAHIVAPEERKDKVLDEIRRPVFSLLEKGPLSESCSYISYDAIKELAGNKKLEHMRDSVLEDYEEIAEEFWYDIQTLCT